MPTPIVLCPLAIEADAVRAAVGPRAEVRCVGPGRAPGDAVRALPASTPLTLLAGLCGGLTPTANAPRIAWVRDMAGRRWAVPVTGPAAPAPGAARPRRLYDSDERDAGDDRVTVIGVDRVVHTPRAKAALAERTGADVIDCESHHFAAACTERGLRFGVIRAVSDGPTDALPAGVERWVDARGRTLAARAALACATRPWLVPRVMRLRRASAAALAALGARVVATLESEALPPVTIAGGIGARTAKIAG